ncbi:LOB domain-containing protein 33 [Camellia lanceoleosa]|uniref:LOB domain-containing protein 33 n=1 Tax=Camellia lanceoleosa TaxID=1840588 RepID=A0ACC0IDL2_9ERIC|nr:LOB domain-containing protein 33 [Camellia lanceoleosa]
MTGLGSSCGACKFLRRRSTSECVFAPYFNYNEAAAHFAVVHKVFGASNVSKLLTNLPMNDRREAAITISYGIARSDLWLCFSNVCTPTTGFLCMVASLQEEIETLGIQMANLTVDVSSCGLILSHST